jgi:FtsH-binding integral membrane protein
MNDNNNQNQPWMQGNYQQMGGNPYMAQNTNNQYPVENKDLENGEQTVIDFDKITRIGFIRKVYGILSAQLALTVSLMALAFVDSINNFLRHHIEIFWIALVLSLVIIIPLACFRSLARGVPQNYILLFAWTLCESYMLATCVSFYDGKTVMMAGGLTLAVTVALTVYACTTKTDFTFCGGFLFCFGTILFVWGLFSLIFGFYSNTLYCCLGVVCYSLYLIYDTQLIMGKFGNEFSIDDYVFAALNIYLDIIQIFLYILQILGRR